MKKYLLSGIISLLLGIFISYFFLTYKDTVILETNLTAEFMSEVYISDYIYHLDGNLIKDELIDTTELGTKRVMYSYRNNYGWHKTRFFNIEVVDTTPPVILVGSSVTIVKDSEVNLEDKIICADNASDYVECLISGEYDISKIGSYNLTITAKDESNNTSSSDFTLIVTSKNKTNNNTNEYTKYSDIYKKYKNDKTLIGLDISKWQGEVHFETLKDNNVEFVMIKLGGQSEIDGEIELDPYFYENIEGAINAGLSVGVYFYSYAKDVKEASHQAQYVLNAINDYDITMPIAFDWENWNEYNNFHLSFYNLNNIAQTFINKINANNYKGVLYSSKNYLENIWYSDKYDIWLANYSSIEYEKDITLWQVCSDGIIDGIDGYVDIDIYYK